MCGGGYSGPSAAEQKAQEEAARSRAQAEADKLKAAQELERQKSGQAALADQVAMANADQARRTRNRTLLAGLSSEEDNGAINVSTSTGDNFDAVDRVVLTQATGAINGLTISGGSIYSYRFGAEDHPTRAFEFASSGNTNVTVSGTRCEVSTGDWLVDAATGATIFNCDAYLGPYGTATGLSGDAYGFRIDNVAAEYNLKLANVRTFLRGRDWSERRTLRRATDHRGSLQWSQAAGPAAVHHRRGCSREHHWVYEPKHYWREVSPE